MASDSGEGTCRRYDPEDSSGVPERNSLVFDAPTSNSRPSGDEAFLLQPVEGHVHRLLTVDIVTFDDAPEWDAHFADPEDVQVRIEPRGSTALFDALGSSIVRFGAHLAALGEHERPGAVQVVVVTDGMENASREWTSERVQAAVGHQREAYQWDFVFLGANQDATFAARTVGIAADAALQYAPAAAGVAAASDSLSRYVSSVRTKSRTGFTAAERTSAMDA